MLAGVRRRAFGRGAGLPGCRRPGAESAARRFRGSPAPAAAAPVSPAMRPASARPAGSCRRSRIRASRVVVADLEIAAGSSSDASRKNTTLRIRYIRNGGGIMRAGRAGTRASAQPGLEGERPAACARRASPNSIMSPTRSASMLHDEITRTLARCPQCEQCCPRSTSPQLRQFSVENAAADEFLAVRQHAPSAVKRSPNVPARPAGACAARGRAGRRRARPGRAAGTARCGGSARALQPARLEDFSRQEAATAACPRCDRAATCRTAPSIAASASRSTS